MRVDDGSHANAKFSPDLKGNINYDAKMIVGWNKNRTSGFGEIRV